MLLRHIYNTQLAQASYLVGCAATGETLVVDPNRDIDQYIVLAEREGIRIPVERNLANGFSGNVHTNDTD